MVIKIFASPLSYTIDNVYNETADEYCIGVDKGAYYALKAGINITLAIGDFDSVTEAELAYIKKHAKSVQAHPIRKDKTDSDLAVSEALKHNPKRIEIYGGVGNRLDHTYANLLLLRRGNIQLINDHQTSFVLKPGRYEINHKYDFISFFAIKPVKELSLEGFSFELQAYDLDVDDSLCISNKGNGIVHFSQGELLVIQAND